MTYFSRDIVTLITALIKKNIISGFTNFVVLTKANLKILGGRENVQQLSIHNTHNLIHAGTTVISTTHVIQELQKYPQLISCRNYKNLISRKLNFQFAQYIILHKINRKKFNLINVLPRLWCSSFGLDN